ANPALSARPHAHALTWDCRLTLSPDGPFRGHAMKRLLALLFTALLAATAHAQSMGQAGYYGRIEIGNAPQPPLLLSNAVMGNPGVYTGEPIYMHVPPAHAYAWSRHCQRYGACDWLVYFVDNDWYANVYVPGFRSGGYRAPVYLPPPVYVAPPY